AEVRNLAGVEVATPEGFVTRGTLLEAMRLTLEREGVESTLDRLDRLAERGFAVAKGSGVSLSPFPGATLQRPPAPDSDDPRDWRRYAEALEDRIAARTDYDEPRLGGLLLSIKSGARAVMKHAAWLTGSPGAAADVDGREVPIRHGLSEGL